MTYDLYFWKQTTRNPIETIRAIGSGDDAILTPSPDLSTFWNAVFHRWEDLPAEVEPSDEEFSRSDESAPRYMRLGLSPADLAEVGDALVVMAQARGLTCYDPQTEKTLT